MIANRYLYYIYNMLCKYLRTKYPLLQLLKLLNISNISRLCHSILGEYFTNIGTFFIILMKIIKYSLRVELINNYLRRSRI